MLNRMKFLLAAILVLAPMARAGTAENVLAVQQSEIETLKKDLQQQLDKLKQTIATQDEANKKRMACITRNSTPTLRCRTASETGRLAQCGPTERVTGGGASSPWGTALVDSVPGDNTWKTSIADMGGSAQTAKTVNTFAICCSVSTPDLNALCP